jgi:hypothetical protein
MRANGFPKRTVGGTWSLLESRKKLEARKLLDAEHPAEVMVYSSLLC